MSQLSTKIFSPWIALAHLLTPRQVRLLQKTFQNGEEVFQVNKEHLIALGFSGETITRFEKDRHKFDIEGMEKKMWQENISAVVLGGDSYPKLLRQIPDAPVVLFYKGNLEATETATLAIVGTRKLSTYGSRISLTFTRELVTAGLTTVSGLARGIDALVHEATVEVGGQTIAVIGSGLDRESLYPRDHWRLAEQIVEHDGLLMSEYAPCVQPAKHHFPERNRLIAGLSRGTLVIEAPEKSGALITAYLALEYNREVMAVPGYITEENAKGTNALLKRGAHLITSPQDVLTILGYEAAAPNKSSLKLSETEQKIVDSLSHDIQSLDDLIEKTGLNAALLSATLSVLEINGAIRDLGGKKYARC